MIGFPRREVGQRARGHLEASGVNALGGSGGVVEQCEHGHALGQRRRQLRRPPRAQPEDAGEGGWQES